MAIFNKQDCIHCGGSTNILTRVKLKDGKYICGKCSEVFPGSVSFHCLSNMTYKDFTDYLVHKEENRKRLETFNVTDVYFDRVYVDMEKDWVVFSNHSMEFNDRERMLNANPDIFEMKDLIYYDFFYDIKSVKEGVFKDKVKADVRLIIAFNNRWYPYSFDDKVLRNHNHDAKIKGIINRAYTFTQNDKKEDLEIYLLSALIENKIDIPVCLGGLFTMNFDFSPYDTYLRKVFQLANLGVYKDNELEQVLENITPSKVLKLKLKNTYKKV
ncbi:MAG: hypothetical protein IJN38_03455 [Clostridia bacterium]|nr:hypothetical protein [Clostridia bacterium]